MQIQEVQNSLQVSRRYKIQGMDIVTTVELEGSIKPFLERFSVPYGQHLAVTDMSASRGTRVPCGVDGHISSVLVKEVQRI